MPCAASPLMRRKDTWAMSDLAAMYVNAGENLYGYCIINSAHYAHDECLTVLDPISKAKAVTHRWLAWLQR